MHDKGNHLLLSEDWLLDNLPEGWTYDCIMGEQSGFLIVPPDAIDGDGYNLDKSLFIPLDLLKLDRTQN